MKTTNLDGILSKAQDESATADELWEVWHATKSIRIRKAIASNPNAGPRILSMASRLYLEEVLENPGFEMLKLFDSDPWVTRLTEAYEDPDKYLATYGRYSAVGIGKDLYTRAILLSKNLTCFALDTCLCYGSRAALDRVIKNKAALQRIRDLIDSGENKYEVRSAVVLYAKGIVDLEGFLRIISVWHFGSVSGEKRIYTEFSKKILEKFALEQDEEKKDLAVRAFVKLLLISRSHVVRWCFPNMYPYDEGYGNYKEFIVRSLKVVRDVVKSHPAASTIYGHYDAVKRRVSDCVTREFYDSNRTPSDFERIREFFESNGLVDLASSMNTFYIRDESWCAIIDNCSVETKEFLVKMGCLGVRFREGDGLKSKIVNDVNNAIYEREGIGPGLLFNHCFIGGSLTLDLDKSFKSKLSY